ncbi:MAG TPA: hypothetical protein VF420_06320 [Casimicrobiaceae bacterium]
MSGTERDSRVDAAWRSASREEPSAVIDEAIRAAARRAVEARPRGSRDKHWWYPLAAAATVAVIAVGLLQLTPPEEVAPVAVTGTIGGLKRDADAAATPSASPASAPPMPAPAAPAPPRDSAPALAVTAVDRAAPGRGTLKKEIEQAAPASSAGTPQGAPRSEPFPATSEPQSRAAQAPPAPPREADVPPPPGTGTEMQNAPGAAQSLPSAARKDARALGAVPLTQGSGSSARAQAFAPTKPKTAPRDVDDWVKLIRDLRGEGRFDDAARELAAFRDAYGERADALLPADLRELPAPFPPPSSK